MKASPADRGTELHVVFGAGQVGTPLAARLREQGRRVRIARRAAGAPPGVEAMTGNAADPAFCARAAEGAAVVYHCMNPPYSTKLWSELVPRFMDNLIAAAGRAGARLVVLDNLYMYGRPGGSPIDEDTPIQPVSRKGEIRARAAARLFEAHRRGDVRATSGRASDFYGPRGTLTHLGDAFWKPVTKGKPAQVLVDPDAVHTYHYVPDVVTGLLALGHAEPDVEGRVWMLPCAPAETLRALAARLASAWGRGIRIARMPRWMVKAAGVFVPLLREIDEMLYQWDEPFVVRDARFRARFGLEPEDPERAAAATVEWARRHYGVGSPQGSVP